MAVLIAGLILFIGVHSMRIVAEGGRTALLARFGEAKYKIAYGLLSLAGLILIGNGYERAYGEAGVFWTPPTATRHLALLLVPIGFVLVVASYVPTGRIKAAVGHPMILGIGFWAFAHLIANGATASVVLFGAFFFWAVFDYGASVSRDRRNGVVLQPVGARGDGLAIVIGLGASLAFIFWLHLWLVGVSPIG
ncbi:MAG: NnrU family protein [Rhizobiaceae bacterium]|nr:NnrU family protein [Rhizobiaceae bacterium]